MAEPGAPVADGLYLAVQRFLYREARLLDDHCYADWFALIAPEARYRITVPATVEAGRPPLRVDILNEDRAALETRIRQLGNPRLTHADNPRTIMRRSVTNVEVAYDDTADRLIAQSYLIAFRGPRPGDPREGYFSARRTDVLTGQSGTFLMAERTVDLDHPVLTGGIVSALL